MGRGRVVGRGGDGGRGAGARVGWEEGPKYLTLFYTITVLTLGF